MDEAEIENAERMLSDFDSAWKNQNDNGAEIKMILLANYGDLAIGYLRNALPAARKALGHTDD